MDKIFLFLKASRLTVFKRFEILQASRHYSNTLKWGKLISYTGGAHILAQAIGFLSGILVIRLLPVEEYAFYTLANTMLGTMTVLADGGISTGVMSEGGKVWQDKKKLGIVISTGLKLRKTFARGSLLFAVPFLSYLLYKHDASLLMTGLIILSLIPAFYAALSDSLLQIVPKLHQEIGPLQKNYIGVGLGRLALTAGSLFLFPFTFLAIFASGVPRLYGNLKLKKIAEPFADYKHPQDSLVREEILMFVKKLLPGAIYYCISGQLVIWLISLFGSTNAIAQVGALSKLMVIMGVFMALHNTLIIPRFARLPDNRIVIRRRVFQVLLILIFLSLGIIGLVSFFPKELLLILGSYYSDLSRELLLITIGSCISLISASISKMNSARGIIPSPVYYIPLLIIVQALLLYLLDVSLLINVLWFSLISASFGLIYRLIHFLYWYHWESLKF